MILGSVGQLDIVKAKAWDYLPFEEFHYLDGHALGTHCYLGVWDGDDAAWCSTINTIGGKGWRVHRFVVLPEFQGCGIGSTLLDWVAEHEVGPFSIRTRNVAFVDTLLKTPRWRPSKHPHTTSRDSRTGHGETVAAKTAVYIRELA